MDITNLDCNVNVNEQNVLANIDKHIVVKWMKEKRTSRTYVIGLAGFIENNSKLTKYVKSIQTKLATGLCTKKIDGEDSFGFNGDHVKTISKMLEDDLKISSNKIKSH